MIASHEIQKRFSGVDDFSLFDSGGGDRPDTLWRGGGTVLHFAFATGSGLLAFAAFDPVKAAPLGGSGPDEASIH